LKATSAREGKEHKNPQDLTLSHLVERSRSSLTYKEEKGEGAALLR